MVIHLENELKEVEVESIKQNPHQPRKDFSLEDLEELAASIEEIGLIHPPLVRLLEDGTYELIAGERRLRALKLLGYPRIPVVVRETSDQLSAKGALIENLQRVDLNPLEVAYALRDLAEKLNLTQEELADRVSKKRSTVANYLRLLHLQPKIQEYISSGKLTMGHAKAILSMPLDKQLPFAEAMIVESWTVRESEKMAKNSFTKNKKSSQDLFLKQIKKKLEHVFGTEVDISIKGKGGEISIKYHNLDDLDRLLHLWEISLD